MLDTKKAVTKGITTLAESLLKYKIISAYSSQEFGIFITDSSFTDLPGTLSGKVMII